MSQLEEEKEALRLDNKSVDNKSFLNSSNANYHPHHRKSSTLHYGSVKSGGNSGLKNSGQVGYFRPFNDSAQNLDLLDQRSQKNSELRKSKFSDQLGQKDDRRSSKGCFSNIASASQQGSAYSRRQDRENNRFSMEWRRADFSSAKEPEEGESKLRGRIQFYQSVLELLDRALRGEDVVASLSAKISRLQQSKESQKRTSLQGSKKRSILEMALENPGTSRRESQGGKSGEGSTIFREVESEYKSHVQRDESEEYQLKRMEVGLSALEKEIGRLNELKKKHALVKELEVENKRRAEISRSNALRFNYLEFNEKKEKEKRRLLLERLRQEGVDVEAELADGLDEEEEGDAEPVELTRELDRGFSNSRPTASTALPLSRATKEDITKHASEGHAKHRPLVIAPRINRNNTLDVSLSNSLVKVDNQATLAL
jgi:hypothetical protein